MRRSSATTLQDVAREAGVATMTASVVLNGAKSGTRVSEATRARIVEVATRLRYRPNAVARGLAKLRMDTIGVASIIDGGEVNLYFLEVLSGILEACAKHGQNTTVFAIEDWKRDEQKILQSCDGRVDGIIFIGPMFSAEFAETILHYSPFVALHSSGFMPKTFDLNVDDEQGAYTIVRHLIEQGHRRIVHFTGGNRQGAQRRILGYRRAIEEAGIAFDPALVLEGEYSEFSGRKQARALIEGGVISPLPTAIFCANDAIAMGCMEELANYGIHAPDDISIAGFDDLMAARMTTPPLTTMRQPFRTMGQRAVELLLLLIKRDKEATTLERDGNTGVAGEQASPLDPIGISEPHQQIFETELVCRQSVGPPPKHIVVPRLLTPS